MDSKNRRHIWKNLKESFYKKKNSRMGGYRLSGTSTSDADARSTSTGSIVKRKEWQVPLKEEIGFVILVLRSAADNTIVNISGRSPSGAAI
jgi:hypothetical protein